VLLVLTAEGVDDIEIILPRLRANGSLGTVRALVSRSEPTRYHLELLEALILEQDDQTASITRRWSVAFSVEKVTKSFYLEFKALRDRLVGALQSENPGSPLLAIEDGDERAQSELRRYVTRNLGRVLFLWFIQSKGWLDGDSHYLANLYNTRCRVGGSHDFFTGTLIPLFFDALAKKPEERPKAASALGELPYLNGGLFIQSTFEDLLYGPDRKHVDMVVPNELFDPRVHSPEAPTVLGLLSSYRFTTQESTPDDQSVDPDPELLGKVFENLNEDRRKTGTFYTPREVVRFMCRATLDGYLRNLAGVNDATLRDLRLEALDPTATDIRLSPEERSRLEKALLDVKVCDPAVGSGAFPVGMLQEIVQLLIGIEQSADVTVSVGGQRVAEWKEKVITNCLYGVDINPEAVEICHLRLWLSMVIDAERPVPLPNLDFRFEAGDSLVDRIAELPLEDSLGAGTQASLVLTDASLPELQKLRAEYALADDPKGARRLRLAIRDAQRDVVGHQVDHLITETENFIKELETRLRRAGGPKAKKVAVRRINKRTDDMRARLAVLERVGEHVAGNALYKKPFLWPVEFPEVFDRDGFDIVIGNPPYVRQEKLAPEDQEAYAASFPEVHKGTADLLVYFFARAIHILKPGGRLALITSNKFHRAGYGEGLREHLPKAMTIEHVIDFGDLAVFDAIAYPSIFVGANCAPRPDSTLVAARLGHVVRRELAKSGAHENVASVRERLADLGRLVEENGILDFPQVLLRRDGWVLEDPELARLMDRLMQAGKPLGEFVEGRMYRGVVTGRNKPFEIDEAKREELIGADPRSEELIKSWLRGKHIKRWRPEWAGLYVIFTRRGTRIDDYPAIKRHLERWRETLTPKATSDQEGPGRKPGSYEWYEIQDAIAYYTEFEQPKIVWAAISPEPRFLWDTEGFYVNDKANIITGVDRWLVAILNSTLMHVLGAARLMPERQGGNYEWKPTPVASLPIITPSESEREMLSAAVDASVAEPGLHDAAIDEIVASVYRLTETENALLDQWVDGRRWRADSEEPADE
jgi:hypothetical protein